MTTSITVRSVNPALWRELKAEAAREGLRAGQAINHAIEKWLYERKGRTKKTAKSFWEVQPIKFSGNAKKLSEETDKTLYGWEK